MNLNIKKIKRSKSPSYRNNGPWDYILSEQAEQDLFDISPDLVKTFSKVIEDILIHPYEGNVGQHPLWQFIDLDDTGVIWSCSLTRYDRITYLISKDTNSIIILNVGGHRVKSMTYSNPYLRTEFI